MRKLGTYFIQGLVAVLPLFLTLYFLWWLGATTERALGSSLRGILPEGWYLPGSGLLIGFALVCSLGMVLRITWARWIWSTIEAQLEKLPLIKTVYGSFRDFMGFFAGGDQQERMDQVVRIDLVEGGPGLLGLVTNNDAREITGRDAEEGQVAVYLPMSYQLGGYMVIVPADSVEPIDMPVEDALRIIVTAGLPRKREVHLARGALSAS